MSDALRYITGELPELLTLLQESDVRELEVREGEMRVRLRRAAFEDDGNFVAELLDGEGEPLVAPVTHRITSPLVGTFYRAPKPGTPPLVEEGSAVDRHTVVGIIEALNVLTEVEAGCSGVVTAVLATDGLAVQYGQVLFEVTPLG